ncbi:hypothetical protein GJ700_12590 [Duganella sp. FT92W]|uniref:Uncharacterized protein n=1 Tax=Pseudoduganella rivuli TaxID=2666085 RepID=A0A7X2IMY8_9BURK|nr:hypothetical protein [Pseudoduganella rivuli]MRV72547.1 hypothetical protein [Pseudoduganella rivuli]
MGSVDKQMVLDLVRRRPGVRVVEIADELDMDAEQVENQLRSEIDSGAIEVKQVTAPNGRAVNSYRFARSACDVDAVPRVAATQKATPIAFPAVATRPLAAVQDEDHEPERAPVVANKVDASVAKKESPAPVEGAAGTSAPPQNGATRVDLAMACIRAAGEDGVDNVTLTKAMQLAPGRAPSSYLTAYVRSGAVTYEGRIWKMGNESARPDWSTGSRPAQAVVDKPREAKGFRCGSWSDGTVELERNGLRLAVLDDDECDQLLRVLQARKAA